MKTLLIGAASLAVLLCTSAAAFAEEVRVTLTGVEARGGQILASLQTESEFMQPRGAYGVVVSSPAANGDVVVVFPDVAPGVYSFSALHDVNGDHQMQRDPDGRPLEGWAMHNGTTLRALPQFAQVSFTVASGPVALTEAMIYP